jgi:hypothetical protein
VLVGAFGAELAFLLGTLAVAWPQSVPAAAALALCALQQYLWCPRGHPMRQRLQGYDGAPLAEFYFFLLPVSLALARSSSPEFLGLAAIFVAAAGAICA